MNETCGDLDAILGTYPLSYSDRDALMRIVRKRVLVGFFLGLFAGLWLIGWPLLGAWLNVW